MTAKVFNIAALVLNYLRAGLVNVPVDNTTANQLISDIANGKKLNVAASDEASNDKMIRLLTMNFVKLRPDAVIPTKATDGSVGFDLTLLGMHSVCPTDPDVFYFNTGLKVRPPPGYYTKIYARSSIIKSGYSLANSVGIIDVDYRGELLVALRRHKADAVLTFPCRLAQLVPELDHSFIMSVEVEELDETQRGEGGFGSTGK